MDNLPFEIDPNKIQESSGVQWKVEDAMEAWKSALAKCQAIYGQLDHASPQ